MILGFFGVSIISVVVDDNFIFFNLRHKKKEVIVISAAYTAIQATIIIQRPNPPVSIIGFGLSFIFLDTGNSSTSSISN